MSGTTDYSGTTVVTQPLATGEIVITGTAGFEGTVAAAGVNGTALLIDEGGQGTFDTTSEVTLGGNAIIGDSGGQGTLAIVTGDFTIGSAGSAADLIIGGSTLAAGSEASISGGLTVNGAVLLGGSAAAGLELSGVLETSGLTIGNAGTLTAGGDASAALGGLLEAGTLTLGGHAAATAANLLLTGDLQLTGQSALTGMSSAVIGGAGSLGVGQGAVFSAGELNAIAGGIAIAGTLQIAGNLVSAAAITLAGGTLSAAAMTLSGGGLTGYGEVAPGAATLSAMGDITASGGTLVLDGDAAATGSASFVIEGTAALDLLAGASGDLLFEGLDASLIIDDIGAYSASVFGMQGHDVIDLANVAPSLVSYSGGVVSVAQGGNRLGQFSLTPANAQPAVEIISDGDNGALITLGGEMACFALGTRLLTPGGYVPVEQFKPGDPIITHGGIKKPVRWIGRRVMELGAGSRSEIRPVIVRAGALGPGCPDRAVRLSPSHAIFIDDVLVPVMHLVNGATIVHDRKTGAVTYYHIELDRHAVVLADRMAVETYLDTGNRGQFHHETGLRGHAGQACAALVTGGARLALLRRQLHAVALAAGFSTTRAPVLHAIAGNVKLLPELRAQRRRLAARFALPPDAGRILLVAPSAAPADTDPDSDDRRDLGICLRRPDAKPALRLGAGWYGRAPGDAGFWMGAGGELFVPQGMTELTLHLAAVAQRWQPPPAIDS